MNWRKRVKEKIHEHELHGNTSERLSVIINSTLAFFTLIAIYLSYSANRTSQEALRHSIIKDSLDGIKDSLTFMLNQELRKQTQINFDSSLSIAKKNSDATFQSLDISRKAFAETQRMSFATIKLANATENNLSLSKENLKFNVASFQQENRAYLSVMHASMSRYAIDTIIEVKLSIQNLGKTPAYRIKSVGMLELKDNEFDVDTVWLKENNYSSATINLGPQQEMSYVMPSYKILNYKNARLFETGKYDLFFLLKIKYYDMFNKDHILYTYSKIHWGADSFVSCEILNSEN